MSAMSVYVGGVHVVCMLCAWERWEFERSVCAVGMYVWGRDVMLLVCDVTCDSALWSRGGVWRCVSV